MIRAAVVAAVLLAAVPACASGLLFPDVAVASIRANHPEFGHNPIMVTCRGPNRTTTWRSEPEVAGVPGNVVQRVLIDRRCDYPWNQIR